MNKNLKVLLLTSIVAFVITGVTYKFFYKPDRVIVASAEYPYDITDEVEVVKSAENVVLGTVTDVLDVQEDEVGVYTPYKVIIEESIKGNILIDEEILVAQRIGYDNDEKAHIKMTESDDYMKIGETFIFSLRYDKEANVHRIIVPEYGNFKVKSKEDKIVNSVAVEKYKSALKKK